MAVISSRGVSTGRPVSDVPSGRNNADVSQREDLANFISMITRDETPFISSIGKTKATAIYHEWQTDELAAPGNSRISEGLDYLVPGSNTNPFANGDTQVVGADFNVVGPMRSRLGNYCQINGKTIAVSGTRRAIDQAGVADEYAYQLKKRGTELKRDIEHDLVHSFNVANAASPTGARTMGTFQAWINDPKTVNYVGNAAAPAAANRGIGTHAVEPTGTGKGSLSLSDVDEVMQKIYQEGGKANKIMVSPKIRRDFSDLMVTDAGVRRNLDEKGKLRQSVDVYMSDFGDVMVVPNYVMGLTNTITLNSHSIDVKDYSAFIYDSMWFSMATLRPLQEIDVGQRGDSTVGMMVEEFTMEVKNPVGCGAIYGLE
ncbi:MAG: DUF5309 domain-containing protein [Actinomycetia bacterium]|nr:DUF5309 domain-containing protein [Actinomycetes bacterium]